MKNLGTGVMLVAAVLIAVVIVILPHNTILPNSDTSKIIQTPNNQESFKNTQDNAVQPRVSAGQQIVPDYNNFANKHNFIQNNPEQPFQFISIDEVISRFNAYVEETFPKTGIPGSAIVVVYQDQVVYMKALGVKEVGTTDPVDFDTIFQIGSCTKAFTATTIAALVDDNVMTFDDRVQDYYLYPTEFDLYDPGVAQEINMRDLLSHRTGLPIFAGTHHVLDYNYDFQETLFRLRYIPPASEFRTTWAYQNIPFALAGYSSSRASGTEWGKLVEEKILEPLEMTSTVTNYADFVNHPNHSSTHYITNGVAQEYTPFNLDTMGPAGSISSSIIDMANWIRFQLNHGEFNGQQVVSSESLAETHKPHIIMSPSLNLNTESVLQFYPSSSGVGPGTTYDSTDHVGMDIFSTTSGVIDYYGLGWILRTKNGTTGMISHAGSTITSTSNTNLFPADKLGIVVLANEGKYGDAFGTSLLYNLYSNFYTGSSPVDYWPILKNITDNAPNPYEQLPDKPTDPDPLPNPINNYLGTFYSNYWGNITIKIVNNTNLLLYPGNNPTPVPLSHWSGNVFRDDERNTAVNFTDDSSGTPQNLEAKRWAIYGANGTFNRT